MMSTHRVLILGFLAATPCMAQTTPKKPANTTSSAVKIAEQPIPPFTVWQLRPGDSTETQVSPFQLNPSGYWIMLYLDTTKKASLDLLAQVQTLARTQSIDRSGALIQPQATSYATPSQSQFKLDPSKLVIVVADASGAQLSQFQTNYPGLVSAAWAHDSSGAAAKLLGIRGTPHLFGMREGLQRWQLSDNLGAQDLEPVLTTWSAFNRLPKNTLTRRKVTPPATTTVAHTTAATAAGGNPR